MQSNNIIAITVPEKKIRDYIDGKLRNDTPEEYVRQNIEKRLVVEHFYPKSIIRIEFGIKMGSANKRVDIALFPENCTDFTQDNIKIIVECKKEGIKPSDKKEGVEQLKSYMTALLNCEWGMWTNGQEKEVWRKIDGRFEEYIDIPSFRAPIEEIDRPKRSQQKKAIADNLLFAFKKCHNVIYANEGLQKQPAFFELLKLIFCKIEDEKNIMEDIHFYTTSKEKSNQDGQLTAKKRVAKIFDKVKAKYSQIFVANDVLELSPRTIAGVVGELQKYSLLDTTIDVKGRAYEEIVGSNLRGDRGEFFTPRNVMAMAVKMVNPRPNEKVLDSSCGTGGFLVNAMNHVIGQIKLRCEKQFGKEEKFWNDSDKQRVRDIIADIAKQNFFGIDINPDLVKATKMNMVMNNDGSGNILRENSLLPPHEWNNDFKDSLAKALSIEMADISHHSKIGFFDVIVTNPPFGSKIPIDDTHILAQYNIAKNSKSMPPEQIFIERCIQFLKPGGRLAIVLPDSILGAPGLIHIRKWLLKYTRIIASIDLHQDTFQPFTGVQTSVLIVQKKTAEERNDPHYNYPIFMAMVDKVGHDKRGNPVLKRNKDGEVLYFPHTRTLDNGDVETYEETELDDQTLLVPDIFTQWKKEEGLTW